MSLNKELGEVVEYRGIEGLVAAEVLKDKGKVTAAIAKAFAESEFEQYRIIQDKFYQSDFDRFLTDIGDGFIKKT